MRNRISGNWTSRNERTPFGLFTSLLAGLVISLTASMPAMAADNLGVISAQGFGTADGNVFKGSRGKMMARRAAVVDAQRNLLETINGVRITAGTTVKDLTLESDVIGNRVKGMLQGAFKTKENIFDEEGTFVAEVELTVCLNSAPMSCREQPTLSALVQPSLAKPAKEDLYQPTAQALNNVSLSDLTLDTPQASVTTPTAATDSTSLSEVTLDPPQTNLASEEVIKNTGLIVDLSAQDFAPMLDVRVRTDQGKELYGPGHVADGTDWLHWSNSIDGATQMQDIVGDSPLVITADALDKNGAVLVSNDSALSVYQNNLSGGDFLKQGKVVFVVN